MRRPFWIIGCAILVTMAAVFSFSLPPLLVGGVLLALGLLLLLPPIRYKRILVAACLSGALACSVAGLYLWNTVEPLEDLAGQGITVTGVVQKQERYTSAWAYWVRGTIITDSGEEQANVTVKVLAREGQTVQPGDWVQATGVAQWNLEGSFASYAFSKGEFLSLWLEGELEQAQPGPLVWQTWIPTLCHRLLTAVDLAIPNGEDAAVVRSMVFGDTSGLTLHQQIVLRRAGTVHFIAVSGLHVTLVGALCLALFGRIFPGRRLSRLATVGGIWLFVALVGFAPSAVRAGFMLSVLYLGELLSQRNDSLNTLGLAMAVMTLFQPNVALDVGFWMSVAATAGLLLLSRPLADLLLRRFFPKVGKRQKKLVFDLSVGIGAVMAVSPVTLYQFGYVTPLSPLASLVVSPLSPILLATGILTALLGQVPFLLPLARITGWVAGLCGNLLCGVSECFARIPFSALSLDQVGRYFLLWLPAVLAVGVVLLYRRKGKLLACWVLLGTMVLMVSALFQQILYRDTLTVWLPQGGEAFVIQKDGRCAVVGSFQSQSAGESLAQQLATQGLTADLVVVTDPAGERLWGLTPLLQEVAVEHLVLPQENNLQEAIDREIPKEQQTPLQNMDIVLFDRVTLQVRLTGEEAQATLLGVWPTLVKSQGSPPPETGEPLLMVGEENKLFQRGNMAERTFGMAPSAQGGWNLLLPILS